jgi:hypothetical protein
VREHVGPAPDRAERAQPSLVKYLERVQIEVDRLGALEVQDRRQHAIMQACSQLVGGAHDPDLPTRLGLDPE